MLLLTSSIGSVLTSSVDRAGGDGVKLSLSVDEPKLPPPLPFVVKLIVSFKLLLLLLGTLLFVLRVLLLFPFGCAKYPTQLNQNYSNVYKHSPFGVLTSMRSVSLICGEMLLMCLMLVEKSVAVICGM
jgi:hypothetical protein